MVAIIAMRGPGRVSGHERIPPRYRDQQAPQLRRRDPEEFGTHFLVTTEVAFLAQVQHLNECPISRHNRRP